MQISDIHVGNRFDYRFLINSFKEAQQLKPEIVVYTGDYVSWENKTQLNQLAEVMQHAVTGSMATLAVLGNHDYGVNWQEENVALAVKQELKKGKITVLRNEAKNINGLNIIGMDECWGTNFNPEKAMYHFKKETANITLCHNPDVCDWNVWGNYKGWILSGHTHGGQVKPPFLPPPVLPVENKNYTAGKFNLEDGKTLYINRALGHLYQVRFNVRPEITLFELQRA